MKKKNNTELKDFFEDENKTINAETMFHKNMKVYGLDVLEDRALADYRDGLKPAQRRLMWTAKELKATWENKTVKSARITGDCFTGDTEILTVNNEKLPIAKLEKMIEQGENVYTFSSSETGEIEVSKVVKCWKKTETDNLVKVYLDNDTYFECTPDHKIMLRDGTYQKAIELKDLINYINATVRRYPVSEEYKKNLILKSKQENSAQSKLNLILNDLLMKNIFSNEFRNLNDFMDYERILVEKMFSLLSSFVEYDVAGIYFASPDDFAENKMYIDTIGKNLPKNLLSDINYDFFRKMEEHKTIKGSKFEVVRMLLGKEFNYTFNEFTSKIIIPLIFDKKLIGGICFYSRKNNDYASFRFFDIMISELLAIFKMKYQFNEKEFMSVLDGLTGLYNRRQLEIAIAQEYNRTRRHPSDFSLAILDIDFFKKVNDTYGHQYGDYVLKTVADLMKKCFRKTDLLYRYGGEELIIIMPETNIEGAVIPVQRLRRMVEEYNYEYNEIKAKVTVSIGLTMNYQTFNSPTEIIKSADEALYKAKESGRNRVILYEQ